MALRRSPKQARGERRIEAILEAAAHLFDQLGYDAVTTILIAQHANTAVGSLYDFFPNKEAIAQALIERFSHDLTALLNSLISDALVTMPIDQLLNVLVDPLVAFINTRPGFRALYLKAPQIGQLSTSQQQLEAIFSQRMAILLLIRYPQLQAENASRIARISIATTKTLTALAIESGIVDQKIIADLKLMIRAYITQWTQLVANQPA